MVSHLKKFVTTELSIEKVFKVYTVKYIETDCREIIGTYFIYNI